MEIKTSEGVSIGSALIVARDGKKREMATQLFTIRQMAEIRANPRSHRIE
jgi:hypothetical protein